MIDLVVLDELCCGCFELLLGELRMLQEHHQQRL